MLKEKFYSVHGCFTLVLFNITLSLLRVVQKIFGLGNCVWHYTNQNVSNSRGVLGKDSDQIHQKLKSELNIIFTAQIEHKLYHLFNPILFNKMKPNSINFRLPEKKISIYIHVIHISFVSPPSIICNIFHWSSIPFFLL